MLLPSQPASDMPTSRSKLRSDPLLLLPDVLLMLSTSLLLLLLVVLIRCSHSLTSQLSPSTLKHAVTSHPFLVLPSIRCTFASPIPPVVSVAFSLPCLAWPTFSHSPAVRGPQLPFLLITAHSMDSGGYFILFPFTFYPGPLCLHSDASVYPPPVHIRWTLAHLFVLPGMPFCLPLHLPPTHPSHSFLLPFPSGVVHPHYACPLSLPFLASSTSFRCLTEVCVVRTFTTYSLTSHQPSPIPQNYAHVYYTPARVRPNPRFTSLTPRSLSLPSLLLSYLLVFK